LVKNSSSGFFSVGFVRWQKPNVLFVRLAFCMLPNGLQLPEGGVFEAIHCQPSTNFDRSTKLDLTTEPPLLGRCCCVLAFLICHLLSTLNIKYV